MPKVVSYTLDFRVSKDNYLHYTDLHIDDLVSIVQELLDEHYDGMDGIKVKRRTIYNMMYYGKALRPLKAICKVSNTDSDKSLLEVKKQSKIKNTLNLKTT